jgi:hypothetical protein
MKRRAPHKLDGQAFLLKGKQIKSNGNGGGMIAVDTDTFKILVEMIRRDDTIINAMRSVLGRVLHAPFWFEIPAMKLMSDSNMEKIIKKHWLPWCETALEWWFAGQVIPFFSDTVEGIPIPRSPEFKSGMYQRVAGERSVPKFKWFWKSEASDADSRVQFIVGRKCPDLDGKFQCDLISLIPFYRAVKAALKAIPKVIEQRVNPTHALERRPPQALKQMDDKLVHLTADFGAKAVGATQLRIEQAHAEEQNRQQKRLEQAMIQQQKTHEQGMTQIKPILLSDTNEELLDEMDTGIVSRLYAFPSDYTYRDFVRAELPFDYEKLKRDFDIRAAAIMDYPYELLDSTVKGVGKAAALQGAKTFGDDRIRSLARFFETIVHQVLIHLYKPHFRQLFKNTDLHPELDVSVQFSITSNIEDETLFKMYEAEVISKSTLARYLARNHNVPEEDLLKQ